MRRSLWIIGLLAVVVAGAYFGAARRTTGPPLDPGSTAADGTKGLVELIAALGGSADVVDGAPDGSYDRAVLLEDRLSRTDASRLEAWVRAGGVLVVADPSSLLAPPTGPGAITDELAGRCDVPGLEEIERLDVGIARSLDVPAGSEGCFTAGGGAFVVATPTGAGSVVALGGPDLFTNELLDEADNAALAGVLLSGDGARTAFVRPALPGGGDRGLVDLIDTPVRAALVQLVVAFVVVVLWRARRLGRPIEEPQPVDIEGSELTRAVGRLLAANRRPDRAAALLRDRARRELSGALGLPLDATIDRVVTVVADRTSLTEDDALRAVASPVTTDAELVSTASLLARIHEEIRHDQPTADA